MTQQLLDTIMETIVVAMRTHGDPREYTQVLADRLDAPYRDEAIARVGEEIDAGWILETIYPDSSSELRKLAAAELGGEIDDREWSLALQQLKSENLVHQFGPGRGRALALWADPNRIDDDTDQDPRQDEESDEQDILPTVAEPGKGQVVQLSNQDGWGAKTHGIIRDINSETLTDLQSRLQRVTEELADALQLRDQENPSTLMSLNAFALRVQGLREELESMRNILGVLERLVLAEIELQHMRV